jgi:hypothetical protein
MSEEQNTTKKQRIGKKLIHESSPMDTNDIGSLCGLRCFVSLVQKRNPVSSYKEVRVAHVQKS